MSARRRMLRAQQQRAHALWQRLGRKGHRGGIACLTCSTWLSEYFETNEERSEVYRAHEAVCPQLMLSSLDLKQRPAAVPARHALAAAKGLK